LLAHIFKTVREASRKLGLLDESKINQILMSLALEAERQLDDILAENKKDLDRMSPTDPKYDRLKLTAARIKDIANDLRNVASLPSPLGINLEKKHLNNGLSIEKVSVPLGVVGVIYEARPNVTFDVFSLCLKSGNACILKGGSDAEYSNRKIVSLIQEVIAAHQVDNNCIALLPTDRSATQALLHAVGYVDIIIPRGSQSLINHVRDHAKVPVIETGAGIVHTYFDVSGDLQQGADIVFNAKTRRVSVCNALDCLIIHEARLKDLPVLTKQLQAMNVQLFADEKAFLALKASYPEMLLAPAGEEHFGTEFFDYKMSIKTVDSLEQALDHIAQYSSKHSEAIIAKDEHTIDLFMKSVDAAAVYANASTAFTDGAQFGLGAEIGISTQKLHARGPMGLREMTSYKWLVKGNGAVRKP
jgi:glutamate-5-semialdehyde dehydrogenase